MWKTGTIAELCEIEYGTRVVRKNESGDEFPVYGGGGETFRINRKNRTNRLVVSRFGMSENCTRFVDGDFFLNDSGLTVSPKVSDLSQAYLDKVILAKNNEIYSLGRGSAQKNLNMNGFKALSFHYPSMAEQQRIVAKLDAAFAEIDEAISVTQSQTSQAHNLFENIIAEQFSYKDGYERKTLQDICEKITDGTHQTPKYYEEGYIFLSSKNVTSRKIDWENVKYVDESQHVEMQKRLSPKVGDVLLAKNGTTGVAAMVDKDVIFNIYVSLAWLRSKGDVTPEYLLNFVNSKLARQQFSKRTKGIGVPNLHLKEIREVEISFPSELSHQQKIVSKVSSIDEAYLKYCEILKDKLEKLKMLKSAIVAQELQSGAA